MRDVVNELVGVVFSGLASLVVEGVADEQVPGLIERYQRRTRRLADQLGSVVPVVPVPRVLGVDDFALKRRHRYATVLVDAKTGERINVLPSCGADALERWLREHPGVEIVCRDGSGQYGEAVRRALPAVVQVSDRRHLWKNLCEKTPAEVRSQRLLGHLEHAPPGRRPRADHTRTPGPDARPPRQGRRPARMRPPHEPVPQHRQALRAHPRTRGPASGASSPAHLVDPYRDHLRERRAADPAFPVNQLFREVQEQGYTGSFNLLYRYITQGRAEGDRPLTTPRWLARLLLTHPDHLRDKDTSLLAGLTKACP